MHSVALAAFALLTASSVSAALMQAKPDNVADTAGGNVPNGPPPANITDAAITHFQGVNFLENLEAAFFEEGLKNLTEWNDRGYLNFTIDVVTKVHAVSPSTITFMYVFRITQLTPISSLARTHSHPNRREHS